MSGELATEQELESRNRRINTECALIESAAMLIVMHRGIDEKEQAHKLLDGIDAAANRLRKDIDEVGAQ